MARTAETIYAGDASSLIRATREAKVSVADATGTMIKANVAWSRSAAAAGEVAASAAAKAGASAKEQAAVAGAAAREQAAAVGASSSAQVRAYMAAADAAEANAIRTAGANEKSRASFHGVGLAVTAAAAAIVVGVKRSVDTLEELGNTTLKLHNLTGLSVQSASAYAAVAKVNDINARALSMSFITLSKNLHAVENAQSGATKGAKTQELAFKQLGVPVAAITAAHGNLNKILPQVVAGFERLPGSVNKTAIAQAIFGRGAKELVPLMHGGALGLKEQLHAAEEYGAVLGIHTNKQLIAFKKAQEDGKYASLGLQVAIAQDLAPALTSLIHTAADAAHEIGGGVKWLEKHEAAAKALAVVLGTVLAVALADIAYKKAVAFVDATKLMIGGMKKLAAMVAIDSAAMDTSLATVPAAAETAAVQTSAAWDGLATDIATADATIETANTGLVASFGSVMTKIAAFLPALALAGAAIGEASADTSESGFKKVWRKNHPGQKPPWEGYELERNFYEGATTPGGNERARRGLTNIVTAGGGGRTLNAGERSVVSLQNLGLSSRVAQGIVKALQAETQGNLEKGAGEEGKEGAFGIAQWLGSRRGGLEAFAKSRHKPASNLEIQLEYLAKELQGPERGTLNALRHAHGVNEASGIFIKQFERPESASTVEQRAASYAASQARKAAARVPSITAWAEAHIGKFPESRGSNTGPELDKLQKEFGMRAQEWCAMFATTAAAMGGASKAVKTASVGVIREWAEQGSHGFQKGVSHTPVKGSLMMFGNEHVAFVKAVHGSQVETIEGNTSAGKVSIGHRNIREGDYATPLYKAETAEKSKAWQTIIGMETKHQADLKHKLEAERAAYKQWSSNWDSAIKSVKSAMGELVSKASSAFSTMKLAAIAGGPLSSALASKHAEDEAESRRQTEESNSEALDAARKHVAEARGNENPEELKAALKELKRAEESIAAFARQEDEKRTETAISAAETAVKSETEIYEQGLEKRFELLESNLQRGLISVKTFAAEANEALLGTGITYTAPGGVLTKPIPGAAAPIIVGEHGQPASGGVKVDVAHMHVRSMRDAKNYAHATAHKLAFGGR